VTRKKKSPKKLSYQELSNRRIKAHDAVMLSGLVNIDQAVKNAEIKVGRSSSSKSVLLISDMHVGSIYAVRSPEAFIADGSALGSSDLSEQLYDNWTWARDQMIQKPKVLIINGEPIDGSNKKSVSGETWTPSVQHQLDDAEKLIKIYNWDNIVMTRGSRYHVTVDNTYHEEFLAKSLGCIPYGGLFGKAQSANSGTKTYNIQPQYTDFYLWFILQGKRFSVCHHVGYNKTELYRTTAIGREGAVMEFARGKWYPENENVDVIARSHVHYYVEVRYNKQIAFTTPCWKLPDEFQLRRGIGGTAVNIGTIEVIVESNGHIDVYPHIVDSVRYPKPYEINFDNL